MTEPYLYHIASEGLEHWVEAHSAMEAIETWKSRMDQEYRNGWARDPISVTQLGRMSHVILLPVEPGEGTK